MSEYVSALYGDMERSKMLSSFDCSGTSSNSERELEFSGATLRDESDDEDAFISFTTTESRCEILYQRGLELKIQEELEDALLCFEDCLRGMQDCQYFAKLPQTLQQLQHLYKNLGNEDKAGEYGEAVKLFHEATEPKLNLTSLNGGSHPRTKRKPFSKKTPSSLSASSCNPAEYGNLMSSKAMEYEKLASLHAEKGEMDLAMDCCRKAVILRHCVYGQTALVMEAAMAMFEYVYAELEERKGRLSHNGAMLSAECGIANKPEDLCTVQGDLSVTSFEVISPLETKDLDRREVNGSDRGLQSANSGQPHPSMWSTPASTNTRWQLEDNTKLLKSGAPMALATNGGFKDGSMHSTEEWYTDRGENRADSIIRREEDLPTILLDTTTSGECRGNHILDYCGGQDAFPLHDKNSHCWVIPVQPHNESHPHHHHHHHMNLCNGVTKGVTKNLTKLSAELKAPMCVTLDVQTVKPGRGGMEHPRCLPLWVLLLGACVEMALLAYMLYNH